jgi:hypothetical protein
MVAPTPQSACPPDPPLPEGWRLAVRPFLYTWDSPIRWNALARDHRNQLMVAIWDDAQQSWSKWKKN